MNYIEQRAKELETYPGWYYLGNTQGLNRLSGWKFHIFGTNTTDSAIIADRLIPILQKYELCGKVASKSNFVAGIGNPQSIQYGKAGTVYLTAKLFKEENQAVLIANLIKSFKDYKPSGTINGDNSINGWLHYRYELCTPVDPKIGVSYPEYEMYYESNRGSYNIPDNPDPFTD